MVEVSCKKRESYRIGMKNWLLRNVAWKMHPYSHIKVCIAHTYYRWMTDGQPDGQTNTETLKGRWTQLSVKIKIRKKHTVSLICVPAMTLFIFSLYHHNGFYPCFCLGIVLKLPRTTWISNYSNIYNKLINKSIGLCV